jgi:hypothetical protein
LARLWARLGARAGPVQTAVRHISAETSRYCSAVARERGHRCGSHVAVWTADSQRGRCRRVCFMIEQLFVRVSSLVVVRALRWPGERREFVAGADCQWVRVASPPADNRTSCRAGPLARQSRSGHAHASGSA